MTSDVANARVSSRDSVPCFEGWPNIRISTRIGYKVTRSLWILQNNPWQDGTFCVWNGVCCTKCHCAIAVSRLLHADVCRIQNKQQIGYFVYMNRFYFPLLKNKVVKNTISILLWQTSNILRPVSLAWIKLCSRPKTMYRMLSQFSRILWAIMLNPSSLQIKRI